MTTLPSALRELESELADIDLQLQSETVLAVALERVLREARRLTNAEAGTLFLVDGDLLRFAVVQNDFLCRRIGEARMRQALQTLPLPLTKKSLAGYVALTGETLNIADVYRISQDRPYLFNQSIDLRNDYRTRSLLAVPIEDPGRRGTALGVLQLINALDAKGRPGRFTTADEPVARSLAGRAARVVPELQSRVTMLTVPTSTSASQSELVDADLGMADDGDVALAPRVGDHVATRATSGRNETGAGTVEPASCAPAADPSGGSATVGRRLGDLLLAENLISLEQLTQALAEQRRTQQRLGAILVRFNFITEGRLAEILSRQYHLPLVGVADRTIDEETLRLAPEEIARRHAVLPLERGPGRLTVAIADPTDLSALDDIAFRTGLSVTAVVAPLSELRRKIEQLYTPDPTVAADLLSQLHDEASQVEFVADRPAVRSLDVTELRTSADETPIVRLVNTILLEAIKRGASDVHLECFAGTFRVRMRVDGLLQQVMSPAKRLEAAIVSRIKIMANLDIAEHRLPQDGRMKLRLHGREIDLRVSVLPTIFGESVDIRILDSSVIRPDLAQLGLEGTALELVLAAINDPNGVILVTGPTGSGKTTTLYSMIHMLNQRSLKILTVEDPVEYVIDGVNQVHVHDEIGRSFAAALRSFLRHDPDVILVGEMRDHETAQIALRAGLTGHLVLSTLHTNDCPSTIARLLDMGVAPFMLASSVRLTVAQRLLRRLCVDCRAPYSVPESELVGYGLPPRGTDTYAIYRPVGCAQCGYTGHKGRLAVYEVMPLTREIRDAVVRGAVLSDVREAARRAGMRPLREAALARLLAGETSLAEVVRVTALD
jgi:type IV pilus assembly protein PilB